MQTKSLPGDMLATFDTNLVRADTGKRFLNYLIDIIFFYVLIFALAFVLAFISPEFIYWLDDDSTGFGLLDRLFTLVFYAAYMGVMEVAFKGKSIGKLLTGTRAVNLDGSRISPKTAFARGFSRAVPFCVFSTFGNPCNPWQDRWTDTMVIDEKQSDLAPLETYQ